MLSRFLTADNLPEIVLSLAESLSVPVVSLSCLSCPLTVLVVTASAVVPRVLLIATLVPFIDALDKVSPVNRPSTV